MDRSAEKSGSSTTLVTDRQNKPKTLHVSRRRKLCACVPVVNRAEAPKPATMAAAVGLHPPVAVIFGRKKNTAFCGLAANPLRIAGIKGLLDRTSRKDPVFSLIVLEP